MQQSSSMREVYNNAIVPQEIRKISNKRLKYTPKATLERRIKKKKKVSRRKESIKIRGKINEIEMK